MTTGTPRLNCAQKEGRHKTASHASRKTPRHALVPAHRPNAQVLYPDYLRKRRRKRIAKRICLCALAILLIIVCAVGGYAAWYSSALDNALSMGPKQDASVDEVIVPSVVDQPFYALVLGSDSREGSGTSSKEVESGTNQRSDVMILLRVDARANQVTMVSIPRDTPYELDDGRIVKVNEVYNLGGAAASIKAVSEITGVSISHYAEIHFSELQSLVDKLGGVTVDVDVELSYKDALTGENITISPGTQTITGQQAQIFARARHEYITDQDAHRQNNVRSLAIAIVKKVFDRPAYELPNTVLDLASYVGTDMKTSDIVPLAWAFSKGSSAPVMYSCSGPDKGDINESAGGIWLCYENPQGWADLMAVVDSGGNPEGIDVNATAIVPE